MKARKMLTAAIGTLGLVVSAHPAFGRLITFHFAGEVTHLTDVNGLLPPDVGVGSSFSGLYTFESTTPDSRQIKNARPETYPSRTASERLYRL